MSWIMGSADDYRDLSDKLVEVAVNDSLASVDSVQAGGSSYVVGDILTLSGGTALIAAQVEVTGVDGGGAVTAVRRYNDGVYTSNPTDPVSTTGGTGTGCTLNCTFANNGWTAQRNATEGLTSVDSVDSGGSGYSVGDVITLDGGTTTRPAVLEVASVSGGAVTGVTITDPGSYSSTPSDPVAQASVQPSGGTGATFNVTWGDGPREVVLEGEGGGSDEIFIGWRTIFDSSGGYYNLELHGFTGYLADNAITEQPGISDGQYDAAATSERAGAYLLSYPVPFDYFISVTSYRIVIVTKLSGRYYNAYLGFGNRYASASEYPYPMVVCGSTSLGTLPYSTSQQVSGLVDPWRDSSTSGNQRGPMLVYMPDGTWYGVANSQVSASSRNKLTDRVVIPAGEANGVSQANEKDRFCSALYNFNYFIPYSGLAVTPTANLWPTGDDSDRVLLPASIVFWEPSPQVPVELDDVFWVSGYGGVTSEDRIIAGDDVYRVFQNCSRTDLFAYLAIKEG